MSDSMTTVPKSELPEGPARDALAAEMKAGRASVYKQLITGRTIIWLDHGPYAEQQLEGCRLRKVQPEQRVTCDEWLNLFTAHKNAENAA